MDILSVLQKLGMESGFAAFFTTEGGWKNLIMIIIAFVLLYLGIVAALDYIHYILGAVAVEFGRRAYSHAHAAVYARLQTLFDPIILR